MVDSGLPNMAFSCLAVAADRYIEAMIHWIHMPLQQKALIQGSCTWLLANLQGIAEIAGAVFTHGQTY